MNTCVVGMLLILGTLILVPLLFGVWVVTEKVTRNLKRISVSIPKWIPTAAPSLVSASVLILAILGATSFYQSAEPCSKTAHTRPTPVVLACR